MKMGWKRIALTVLLVPLVLAALIALSGCLFMVGDDGRSGYRGDNERRDDHPDDDRRGGEHGGR
jgi:hypothetical protein